jgi:hypothetical protein
MMEARILAQKASERKWNSLLIVTAAHHTRCAFLDIRARFHRVSSRDGDRDRAGHGRTTSSLSEPLVVDVGRMARRGRGVCETRLLLPRLRILHGSSRAALR